MRSTTSSSSNTHDEPTCIDLASTVAFECVDSSALVMSANFYSKGEQLMKVFTKQKSPIEGLAD